MKSLSTDDEVTKAGTKTGSPTGEVPPVTGSRSRGKGELLRHAMRWVIPALVVVAILALWQLLVVVLHEPSYFIPSPTKIAETLKDNFRYISTIACRRWRKRDWASQSAMERRF